MNSTKQPGRGRDRQAQNHFEIGDFKFCLIIVYHVIIIRFIFSVDSSNNLQQFQFQIFLIKAFQNTKMTSLRRSPRFVLLRKKQ